MVERLVHGTDRLSRRSGGVMDDARHCAVVVAALCVPEDRDGSRFRYQLRHLGVGVEVTLPILMGDHEKDDGAILIAGDDVLKLLDAVVAGGQVFKVDA